jgi:hypothetical protein
MRVSIELKTMFHRDPQTRWISNTIFDIDAMSVAVPYCDIVVTGKEVRQTLEQTQLNKRMKTDVLCRPPEPASRLAA